MFSKKGELSHSSKRVKNLNTGNIYGSATECAEEESINFSHVCAVCRFNTAQEAEIYYTGKKSGNLNRVCKGQRKTFAGYRWEYV